MEEQWLDIIGYEGYQVSNLGRVKSLGNYKTRKEKILKQCIDKDGYLQVQLCKNGKIKTFKVHRLVAQAFIPNPDNLPQVNHKDENKENNIVSNLEWCTQQYNSEYSFAKPILQIDKDTNEIIREWASARQVERELGIDDSSIIKCCKGKLKTARGSKWRYSL